LALGEESVVDNELPFQDFVVAQAERAEAMSDPAKTFPCRVRICWARVRGPHNLRQKHERRLGEAVLLDDGVE